MYYKACTKHFPILLCTTQLAQSTPQYYFELQKLHKTTPSTTLYYKACTNYFPVLLCTTKTKHSAVLLCTTRLAQNTSQYYLVLQSLHKPLPSTTLYYKACTKHSPVLLCTAKVAQNNSQYYFVLQSLHKALPSTTLYYKSCTKDQQYYFVLQSLHKALRSTTLYWCLFDHESLQVVAYWEWFSEGSQSTYKGWFFVLKPPKLYGNAWKHSTMGHHCALIPLCENFCCCRLIF